MDLYFGYPVFLWQGLANFVSLFVAGLLVAFVTTFYLKRKDESTRVAGVILEKRVDAQHEILRYTEDFSQKLEMPQPATAVMRELMLDHNLALPYDPHIQYAVIFSSVSAYREFFHGFEALLAKHKLWLDPKVRHQMLRMQAYFSAINASLLLFNRIPLPAGVLLTPEEMDTLADRLILILGVALDAELNELLMELEVRMVNSIYKLDLSRPKRSYFTKRRENKEFKKVEKFLLKQSLMGQYLPMLVVLAVHLVEALKEVELSEAEHLNYYQQYSNESMSGS
ncbi:hypothetical protein [Oceanisphaera ostreae]|uniref:Uncharacterized protein n=1 Tax=Oceanisphaera ostreae TaxID=914151 RepID=A0ABW3KE72_9GAMM